MVYDTLVYERGFPSGADISCVLLGELIFFASAASPFPPKQKERRREKREGREERRERRERKII